MILTERDNLILDSMEAAGGVTIDFISELFFSSYNRASRRLRQLKKYGYIKAELHPILGKMVYYKTKCPSYHSLVINEIVLLFKDRIKEYDRNAKLGTCEVDFVVKLTDNRLVLFEIELENRVTTEKLKRIKENMEGKPHDVWIVTNRLSDRAKKRVNIRELYKIKDYYL